MAPAWYGMLCVLSVLTMVTGNLFALRQDNLKRLLAFSSVAQMGFVLVGLSGSDRMGAASVIYFLLVYLFSNLGAFGVLAIVSAATGKEQIDDFRGFYRTNPLLSWVLALSVFSLAGIPPTAGFFGKFFLILAGAGKDNYALITVAALNMIISLYYYLKVVKAIFMDDQEYPIEPLRVDGLPKLALIVCTAAILLCGLVPYVYDYIYSLSFGLN
jgi:NADH-quinone oxidoreductase subunit N